MAYMNEVNNVADAFKGKPEELEQRYAQNQKLIDLLALQKIKSDMEAAQRQMMLSSAQQGQESTTKQKLEKEVFDMTKQDVAQRVAGVAQQRQQEEQQRMQQMLQSGLAQAPAPNMMNFAGGGIVAFAGPEGSYVKDKEEEDEESFMERIFGDRKRPMPLYREGREKLTKEEIEEAKRLKEMGLLDAIKYSGRRVLDALPLGQGTPLRKMVGEESKPETAAPQPDNRALLNRADAALRSQPGTPPPAPAAPPPAAAPAAPRPQDAAPSLSLPALPSAGAPGAPGADQGIGSLQSAVQGRITQDVGRNAAAERLAEENRIRQLYAGTQLSPEEQRQRRLKQFLLGAANRSGIGSVMAGGLAGSLREEDRQRAEQQELLGKAIGAGQKSFEQAEMSSRQGVASGTSLINSTLDRSFQERKLLSDRDIAQLNARVESSKAAASRALQEAQLEANNIAKQDAALRAVNQSIAVITEKIAARYQQEINNAQLGLQAANTEKERKEAQAAIDAIRRKAEAEAERATFDLREQANGIRDRQMASSGLGNFKVEKIK